MTSDDSGLALSFCDDIGAHFPSLKGAPSTAYYLECERLLFERFAPKLRDLVVLKTDLWDGAKNMEILRWAAEQGAGPVGVDVSLDVVREACLSASSPGCIGGSPPSAGRATSRSAWPSVPPDTRRGRHAARRSSAAPRGAQARCYTRSLP